MYMYGLKYACDCHNSYIPAHAGILFGDLTYIAVSGAGNKAEQIAELDTSRNSRNCKNQAQESNLKVLESCSFNLYASTQNYEMRRLL